MAEHNHTYKRPTAGLIACGVGLVFIFVVAFFPVIKDLVDTWLQSDDHSYGILILPVSIYISWQKRHDLKSVCLGSGWAGKSLVTISVIFYIVAYKASISTLSSLSMVFTIWAIVWALLGKSYFKIVFFPLALLLLMIPVPAQFYSMATIPLQLMVSKASASVIMLLNIPVLREGNVIHLPGRTLEVVQACSGLRSLMSLVTLSVIFGYLTLSSNILRGLLIAGSVPSAVLVNIIRVISMVLAFYYMDFDLTNGTPHIVFGVIVFLMALFIVAMVKGFLSKWDIMRKDN